MSLCVFRPCSRRSWSCPDASPDGIPPNVPQAPLLGRRLPPPFDSAPAHHPHTGTMGGLGALVLSRSRSDSCNCVIALPPSGLLGGYWKVLNECLRIVPRISS